MLKSRLAVRFIVAVALLTPVAWAQQIIVYSSGSVAIGTTRQLTAYVPLANQNVKWSVNGASGGNSTFGTISQKGLYTAPMTVPAVNRVIVRATSKTDSSKFGEATITITQREVQLWSISPASVAAGSFTISLNGANFGANSVAKFSGVPLATTLLSPTALRASGTANSTQVGTNVAVTVTNTGLGETTSSAVSLSVTAADPVTVTVAPASATVATSSTQLFTATVTNAANTNVTWSVNGIVGGSAALGTISTAGLFTAPAVPPNPASVTVKASSVANLSAQATAIVNIVDGSPGPGQGAPNLSAARFLQQATFGPTPADVAHLQQIGISAWLTEQFNSPETPIVDPGSSSGLRSEYLSRLSQAPDQLRQRVAYALGQIIVISMNKNIYSNEMAPYLQILSRNAFGNYRSLLSEITVSSQMGKYLDLAKSTNSGAGGGANENYPRELLQLFSIGLHLLNPDGSPKLDPQGRSIPTYDQTTIQQVALALTGWVYPNNAWENFSGPMTPLEANHDQTQKTFLGCTLQAGQNTTQDLNGVLDCLFMHPNVGPFISTRLIRSLVTSNPTPAYVQRISSVFDNNGVSVRGDLRAVVQAILTDAEARNDAAPPTAGRLKEPILHIVSFVRALKGNISPANGLPWLFSRLGQEPLTPPSVFGSYSPLYRIQQAALFGPEFQIYTPTESILRGNFLWGIISNSSTDLNVDLSPFAAVAGNTNQLIDAVDQALLYGRMPQPMRQSLANAIVAQSNNNTRMQTALYLTALSGLYAVQY